MNKLNKKFHILVLGCQMNRADAQRIEQILIDLKWQKAETESSADLIIVVACSVRQAAIDRVYGKAAVWRRRRQRGALKTILTGCVLEADKKKLAKVFDNVISVTEISKLPEILGGGAAKSNDDYLCLSAHYESEFSALVPISNGCNNFCSYCAVPYTRGREMSRSADSVIKECRQLIRRGCKEIILLGQNVNSYHSDSYDFPKLLKKIDSLKGDFWLRFLTSHPKDLSLELIETMSRSHHITPYLHLALQSGDDAILKKMNRHYTAAHYRELIDMARQRISGLAVSTDIIVGFPGETVQQFRRTATLMKELGFDMAYLAQYSPRPHTAAAKLKDNVSKANKKKRWEKLNEILKETALANNKKLVNSVELVLVDGYRKGKCFGKTANFKIINFVGDETLLGKFVAVKITAAGSWELSGERL